MLQPTSTVSPPLDKSLPFNIDETLATTHLSQAIQYQTISKKMTTVDTSPAFIKFHQFIKNTYPLVFKNLKKTRFGEHGLLLIWKGSEDKLKPIMFVAHQDVVPIAPSSTQNWTHPPFSGAIDNGYIWGRGSLDDKDNLISILEASELLLKQDYQPKQTFYFLFNDTEESGGFQLTTLANTLSAEKISFDYILDEGGEIVEHLLPGIESPIAFLSISEKGVMNVKLTAHTKGGHSSIPPQKTAIGILSKAISDLRLQKVPVRMSLANKTMLMELAQHMPFSQRFFIANMWLFEGLLKNILTQKDSMNALLRTTTAPTIIQGGNAANVLPSSASAVINFRIVPGDTADSVMKHIQSVINNPNINIQLIDSAQEPVQTSSITSSGYRNIARITHQLSKNNVIILPGITIGATDSRHFRHITSNIYRFNFIKAPIREFENMHGTNERITIDNFIANIHFYYLLLQQAE